MSIKLKTLHLNWFRGAAAEVTLETGGKSVVIYGPNGSGKSSLVDALEFVLTGGKVGHLASEYSGRRLEHAVPNTHAPTGVPSKATVTLQSGNQSSVTLSKAGMPKAVGSDHIAAWSPTKSILRQDTVTGFVNSTKLDKYNSILPLLGFEPLEIAASNLRALKLEVEKQTQLDRKEGQLLTISQLRKEAFPGMDGPAIASALRALTRKYLPNHPQSIPLSDSVRDVDTEIKKRISDLDDDNARYSLLCQARDAKLGERLSISSASARIAASAAQPLLSERLAILKLSSTYAFALIETGQSDAVDCPACGKPIRPEQLNEHIKAEEERLDAALKIFNKLKADNKASLAALNIVKLSLGNEKLIPLWSTSEWVSYQDLVSELINFDIRAIDEIDFETILARLTNISDVLSPIIEAAASKVPEATQSLVRDQNAVRAALEWNKSGALRAEIATAKSLIHYLSQSENAVREEIRLQSLVSINDISNDVAAMWDVLHPDEPIDEISLYQHEDADKAIDLKLRFHGKEISSPRLTLSEGHRNSLGLCVFLALARKGNDPSPIILDDVVSSFDREHRASVTDLLLNRLGEMQIIVLTHEYDWFIDLNNRLPGKLWSFQQLRPFSEPSIGIQWGGNPSGFEPAIALLDLDPSAAANKARGLLDVHLASMSERLKISMPFVRGPKNDLRHADDMLVRLSTKAMKSSKKRGQSGKHEACADIAQKAATLKQMLIPFANPPSHGRIVPRSEADRIIKAGELLLKSLVCSECSQPVTRSEVHGKHLECECGAFRWDI